MNRIVVKVGSQVLCDESGALNEATPGDLAGQMAALREDGWQVLLVSSGAVAAGFGVAGTEKLGRGDPVTRKQVLAAAGQMRLLQTWQGAFEAHGIGIAQVLVSKSDFQTRRHYLNMRNCIEGILAAGLVPVINENDVVAITELMFTDNDELAGLVAGMVGADLMCLLSAVDGVLDQQGQPIRQWDDAQHDIDELVRAGTGSLGRGGMHSKVTAARKTAKLGTETVIANGLEALILGRIASREKAGTRFKAGSGSSPTKRWLASADDHAAGAVHINQGAADALKDPHRLASLLPVGVERIEGKFERGDVIRIIDPGGAVIGCGRVRFDNQEARGMIGRQGGKPLIHYDYLFLLD